VSTDPRCVQVKKNVSSVVAIHDHLLQEMDDYLLIISELSQLREIDVSIHIFHREGNLTAIKASYVQRMTIARPTLRTIVLSIPMDYTHWVRHEKENMWSRMDGPIPSLWERSVAQIVRNAYIAYFQYRPEILFRT
jgi:hypothetical protein